MIDFETLYYKIFTQTLSAVKLKIKENIGKAL